MMLSICQTSKNFGFHDFQTCRNAQAPFWPPEPFVLCRLPPAHFWYAFFDNSSHTLFAQEHIEVRKSSCSDRSKRTNGQLVYRFTNKSPGWRLPNYLGHHGKTQLESLFAVLREELAICSTSKEVEKVYQTAEKVSSGSQRMRSGTKFGKCKK